MLVVDVPTDQILRVNVLTDQTPRARTVRTDQTHLVNVPMAQIDLVDVLIYARLNFVLIVMPILVNV